MPERPSTAPGPLDGLRVLECGDLVNAPYAAKILGELGAEVVKIEPPARGDRSRAVGPFPGDRPDPETSGLYLALNANKRGVTLDLHTPAGRSLFDRLVASTDILVENVAVGEAEALGLAPERLGAINPALIHLSITPFGHSGPYAGYRGYELNACALSGVVLGLGEEDREPLPLPDFLGDFFTGAVGALGCLLVVAERAMRPDGGGEGEWIDLSSAEAWATFQTGLDVVTWLFGTRRRMRHGRRQQGGPYPNTILPCKDGEFRLIAMTKREWRRFVDAMDDPDWARDPRFQDRIKMNQEHADELDGRVQPWLQARTKAELFDICYRHAVPFTPVKDFRDVVEDPHLAAREFFAETEHPRAGALRLPGAPYHLSRTPAAVRRPAPLLGQHNQAVYGDQLGLDPGELVALRQAGVV